MLDFKLIQQHLRTGPLYNKINHKLTFDVPQNTKIMQQIISENKVNMNKVIKEFLCMEVITHINAQIMV